MTDKEYYMIKRCAICTHYNFDFVEKNVYGKDKRFAIGKKFDKLLLCELYGNVNANDCCEDFKANRDILKKCKEYDAVLISKEEEAIKLE